MSDLVYEKHFQIKETEDEIIKTSVQGWNIDEKWLKIYNEFRLFCLENNCKIIPIKVLDANKNSIVMEKIDSNSISYQLNSISKQYPNSRFDREKNQENFLIKSLVAGLDLQKNVMDFNFYLRNIISKNYYLNYKDFSLNNIHFSKEKNWYALDPDSWRYEKTLNMNGFMMYQFTINQRLAELCNY